MAKEVKKRPKKAASPAGRTRKLTKKQAKTKARTEIRRRKPVIGSFRLSWHVFKIFKQYWKTLSGIVLVYLILNVIFGVLSNVNSTFDSIRDDINSGGGAALWRAAGGFTSLIGSSGTSGNTTTSTVQSIIFVIESLVIIWALRHLLSGQKVSVKQAYYRSMSPLIPFILVAIVLIIQLLPMTIGGTVLVTVLNSVFTDAGVATTLSIIAFLLLAGWSIYMISASIFALYISTLPDMEPRQALRAAKDLVRFRRWIVIRRVLFMPVFLLITMSVVIIPLILWLPVVVPAVFYVVSMLAILFVHTYLYSLYRGLLE
jgi:hypothetical protein